ncbi:SET domain-containing protein [Tothia fuscella]|uniref:SET domain-containing protein n=1 Tax=Tothia fuscella TaxID=1048955 RepID=A0A9P4P1R0_9PEZI|nr:SET domain-containing protein [Tothia fuscella]
MSSSGESNEERDIVRFDLFELKDVPGKGKGLIATQEIQPGTCLISEAPLFTTAEIQSSDTERELVRIIKSLPRDSQRAFLSLHNNNPGREPFSNIVRSNGYPLGPSSDVGGIFVKIARINHSCLANTQQAWNTGRNQETVYAVRNIKKGEEITIAYTIGGTSAERKSRMKQFFGFECRCELCSRSGKQLRTSDANYTRMAELDDSIGDSGRVRKTPEKALSDCRELLDLYRKEKISDARLPRLYYDAFQICIMHGDQARGREFALRCAKEWTICQGNDSEDVLEMLDYADFPSSHGGFGGSMKWEQSIDAIPRGKTEEEMEKWLWRLD